MTTSLGELGGGFGRGGWSFFFVEVFFAGLEGLFFSFVLLLSGEFVGERSWGLGWLVWCLFGEVGWFAILICRSII